MFFPSRGHTGPDPTLRVRAALFIIGAGFVLAGMRVGKAWAVNVGIGVLLVAVLVRVVTRWRAARRETHDE
jgi:hypothetical protein